MSHRTYRLDERDEVPPTLPPGPQIEDMLERLAVLELRPGDQLVLMHPRKLSREQLDRLNESVRKCFPGRKVLVLDEGMTIGAVRADS